MIWAKVLRRKYSKMLSKPDLKATFSEVCLVKTKLKSNYLRTQVFVLEKPYIVYMCIVEIHEMKQGQIQSKRRPTTSNKTCWETLQKYPFFAHTLTKMLTVANWKTVSPLPYCNVVYGNRKMHTGAVKPKQHCTRGGERGGGEFVPFGHDGCMGRNWKLHWNASTLLSEVVDFVVVVLKRAVFNGST